MNTLNRVLEFVKMHSVAFGEAPTIAEIAAAVGKSYETARIHLNTLVARGDLIRSGSQERGWVLPSAILNRAKVKEVSALYSALGGKPSGKIGDGQRVVA